MKENKPYSDLDYWQDNILPKMSKRDKIAMCYKLIKRAETLLKQSYYEAEKANNSFISKEEDTPVNFKGMTLEEIKQAGAKAGRNLRKAFAP